MNIIANIMKFFDSNPELVSFDSQPNEADLQAWRQENARLEAKLDAIQCGNLVMPPIV